MDTGQHAHQVRLEFKRTEGSRGPGSDEVPEDSSLFPASVLTCHSVGKDQKKK